MGEWIFPDGSGSLTLNNDWGSVYLTLNNNWGVHISGEYKYYVTPVAIRRTGEPVTRW